MYEYKFEKVKFSAFKLEAKEDYEELVNSYAKEGWRLVQVLTPPAGGYGSLVYYEFIFERKLED